MNPIPDRNPCKSCGETVECEEITGLLCSQCWLIHEEEKEIAFRGLQKVTESVERNQGI